MPFQAFVVSRRQAAGIPRSIPWLAGLVGLALLTIPAGQRRGVWASEPIPLTEGRERHPDPALARSPRRSGGPNGGTPRSARTLTPTAPVQVFRTACLTCHDNDGRGEAVRDALPKIPDFTDPEWQDSRNDAELTHSILKGKGRSMRPMKDKLGAVDVKQMVAFVRAFRGGKQVVPDEPESPPASERRVAPGSPGPRPADPLPSPRTDPGVENGRRLFQQFCTRCHGPDGTGMAMRATLPDIPNFIDPAWHARQSNPQLVVSILEGRGARMPPFRGRIDDEAAHHLVAYIRSLSPTRGPSTESSPADFETRFRQLEQQFRELERRSRELSPPERSRAGIPEDQANR